jgi:type IV pilus assembly protein PilE
MKRHPSPRGFTLIELMIVVTVIGILATLAYPSYQDYIRRNRRAGIQSFMVQLAAKQEQYVLDARQYASGAGAAATLGLTVPPTLQSYYDFTTVPITATTTPLAFTITAHAIGVQSVDGDLTLTNTGVKGPAGKW